MGSVVRGMERVQALLSQKGKRKEKENKGEHLHKHKCWREGVGKGVTPSRCPEDDRTGRRERDRVSQAAGSEGVQDTEGTDRKE